MGGCPRAAGVPGHRRRAGGACGARSQRRRIRRQRSHEWLSSSVNVGNERFVGCGTRQRWQAFGVPLSSAAALWMCCVLAGAPKRGSTLDHADRFLHGPSSLQAVLVVGGAGFHLVNTGLALLRMLREYVAFQDAVPAFASDTARRVVALLQARAGLGSLLFCYNNVASGTARPCAIFGSRSTYPSQVLLFRLCGSWLDTGLDLFTRQH